jgi:SAM-dependent methyltransferase
MQEKRIEEFWSNQKSSLHREDNSNFYKKIALEHFSLLKEANATSGIVDLGCGAGELLKHLCLLTKIEVAIDNSPSMICEAKQSLSNLFTGILIEGDFIRYLSTSSHQVWMTTAGINQYSNESNLKYVLNLFLNNKKSQFFFLFDCIDPIRYDFVEFISYKNTYTKTKKFFGLINFYKKLRILLRLFLNKNLSETVYLGSPNMGYAQRPSFWFKICNQKNLDVEIISSRYYEYRYHVVIKKITS